MKVLLLSTYELGRQPFGLASPAAWLARAGFAVACQDLSREALGEDLVRAADLVAFYVPMHTATRLAVALVDPVRELNPRAHLCFYGLYAPMNEPFLREKGIGSVIGGEFEAELVSLAQRLAAGDNGAQHGPAISLDRLAFLAPQRMGLPRLDRYAKLILPGGEQRVTGYTEASRGCKHRCRHCPVVPVYDGAFRIVPREVVLEDIRRQVAAGAQHITFGDPDYLNGPAHGISIVRSLHREFPELTYDVTIKVEHLLRHSDRLPWLRDTGCLFITTAVESVEDAILDRLEKHHTRADFLEALHLCREIGLTLQPTFVPFTPWTTLEGYAELLDLIALEGLVESVAPIQLGIRLLVPAGSRLLELEEVRRIVGPFDSAALIYPWKHADVRVDALCEKVQEIVHSSEKRKHSRSRIFAAIRRAARLASGQAEESEAAALPVLIARAAIPYLDEPWYC